MFNDVADKVFIDQAFSLLAGIHQEIYKTPGSRKVEIPVSEKYMLTINEAAAYFSIGVKKLRRMAEDNEGKFAITMGSRYLIVREKFEEYIDSLINGESEDEPNEQTDS